ncbi:uncharacterized protein BT62DRAFT_905096 [Guyanagaster necrorhizus]|uniref:C2H2-type domain-containing protein n=1 Tax=Guyanagaster necrorhizus TaxID=856835 RepID=A0A9P7VLD2_9AGAR|nr:uncharacterized protein BT62DRAFT_905096 [Guyanagaster necrorhizus MCA 3950]KAG7442688.1 hypothetical protein BT62DRAFT_905096 [Guyanagaster necrorhizus MCA 3950]
MEGGAERPYICTEEGCGKNFQRGEHLKRHVNSVHLKYRRYECPHEGCTSTFSRKDNMKQHGRVSHGLPPVAMEMSNGSFSGS